MATVTSFILSDSLDERIKSDVETVTFYDPMTGKKLEIELGTANRKHFDNHIAKIQKYLDAAREVEVAEVKASKPAGTQSNLTAVREWAAKNGYTVGDRGRIKAEILNAYNKAQGVVDPAESEPEAVSAPSEVTPEVEQSEPVKTVEPSTEASEVEQSENERAIADALAAIAAEDDKAETSV